jgi:hypothetical protein
VLSRVPLLWKFDRTTLSRGSKSRNKVSVGEPAEGSLTSYKVLRGQVLERDLVVSTPDTEGALARARVRY